ncbi:MAG: alpha/beta fold hydrolase [Aquirhabdus sp.]
MRRFIAHTVAPIMLAAAALTSPLTAQADTPPPMGANNWSCHPSALHPRPVILVHGTFANMSNNWGAISAPLAAQGYCVYALNYGANAYTYNQVYGLGPIENSAVELSNFVNKVLTSTGAAKVDMIGHSQGGMMPRYYIKNLGGALKVNTLIAVAPTNHGTTLSGLTTLASQSPLFKQQALQFQQSIEQAVNTGCQACMQQVTGSDFITRLNYGGDTVAGVKYTVIETKYDEVVSPYTSAFLSGPAVTNITLQDQNPFDISEHATSIFDPLTLVDISNILAQP